jgi:hypothetical protein
MDSDTSTTDTHKVTPSDRVQNTDSWDNMCEDSKNEDSRKEQRIGKNQNIYRGSSQDVRRQDSQPPSTPIRKPTGAY